MMMMQSAPYGSGGLSTNAEPDTVDATALNTSLNSGLGGHALGSLESRGLNALHRRAQQLKRWHEAEQQAQVDTQLSTQPRICTRQSSKRIQFSEPTLFLAACSSGDYEEIARLLGERRVDINVPTVDGLTALHHACIDDNAELVRHLLQAGADVNALDNEGWSALHATASCGHLRIAELLLHFGADPSLVNVDGELPIDLAEEERMRLLLSNAMRQQGLTDLERLRRSEHETMLQDAQRMVRTSTFEENVNERSGATILHVAACKGYFDVLELLLNDRRLRPLIPIDAQDAEGWTPLAAAAYWAQPMIVELLLHHGADPNAITSAGQTLDQLTEHDLILQLIKKRRQQLNDEKSRSEQQENENQTVVSTPSTPQTESESQRKAHAKRARESRRSTQGISADDVNRAKDQLLQGTPVEVNSFTEEQLSSVPTANHELQQQVSQPTSLATIAELSSPPAFTATLTRPPSLCNVGKQYADTKPEQQLNATICLRPSSEESDEQEPESFIYRRGTPLRPRDSIEIARNTPTLAALKDNFAQAKHTSNGCPKSLSPSSSPLSSTDEDSRASHASSFALLNPSQREISGTEPKVLPKESERPMYINTPCDSIVNCESPLTTALDSAAGAISSCTFAQPEGTHSEEDEDDDQPDLEEPEEHDEEIEEHMLEEEVEDGTIECISPEIAYAMLRPPKFTVPLLIETPCTPEPAETTSIIEENGEDILSKQCKNFRKPNCDIPSEVNMRIRKQDSIERNENGHDLKNESRRSSDPLSSKRMFGILDKREPPNRIYTKQNSLEQAETNKYSPASSYMRSSRVRSLDIKPSDSRFKSHEETTTTIPKSEPKIEQVKPKSNHDDSPKDYKALYEALLEEMDAYKQEVNRREQESNREKRQMQRKLGELEEELKQMESIKADNLRLKEENGALIRVISKLSKGSS